MMRFYRALLRLYPSSYRAEYGDELANVFAMRHRDTFGIVTFLAALADVVPSAIAIHWDILAQDLVYTARTLRRAPGFAITTVLVVALGVGANTAAFSVADFVLFRPLPFPESEHLVKLWSSTPGYPQMELSPPNYRDWKSSAKSFDGMGGYTPTAFNLVSANSDPLRVQAAYVTSDVMSVLRVRPLLGRLFVPADTVEGRSAILSRDLWSQNFGEDPAVVGRAIELDGNKYTVVGVMAGDFHFPNRATQVWTTIQFDESDFADRANNYLNVVARLRSGYTIEQAGAELRLISARLEREYPRANAKTSATIYRMSEELSERTRLLLLALCGAALCTLVLACANLASLLLARAVGREREIAVRTALGAGRERLIRQLVTESVVLALIGGSAGIAVAVVAVPALSLLVPSTLPLASEPTVDFRVLAFASALVVLTVLAFAVIPALRAGSTSSVAALREGTRSSGGRQRVRALLVMIEVAASVALLTSSGLLFRAMWRLQSVELGFQPDDVLTMRTALPQSRYARVTDREQFYTRVLTQVAALPGVQAAAYTSFTPLTMGGGIWPVVKQGQGLIREAGNSASLRMVTPGFFATLRIRLLRGRTLLPTDEQSGPNVAVVSESFAKRYWPNEAAIGKRFNFGLREREVVGIVGDIRARGPERIAEPQVYVPSTQVGDSMMFFYAPKDLLIRSTAPRTALLPEIRRIVREADPRQPISNVMSMDGVVAGETASRFAQLRVLGILALIALLLASVGLHGLLSFTVSRRSQEIGVRVALGAQSQTILRMVLGEGLLLAIGGLVPGVAIAYAAGRGMQAILAGVQPGDPLTFVAAIAICGTASLIGCLRPALRAANVDPATALRAD